MNNLMENNKSDVSRIIACILCIPTIVAMFLDWVRICALNNLKTTLSFLNCLESDYTLLEILNFVKKLDLSVGPTIKKLSIAIGVTEILSILSVVILFIVLLLGKASLIKKFGVVSFVFCSTMFFTFIGTINTVNSYASETSNDKITQIVQATPWPYVMFVCVALLLFVSVFLVARRIENVKK